jgi:hypothetical protein
LKAIAIPLLLLAMMIVAALPLAIFSHRTKVGLVLRLCAGLICLGAWLKFGAQFDQPGEKAGAFMALFAIAYFYVFAMQCVKRKALPIIETIAGIATYSFVYSRTGAFLPSTFAAVSAIVILYLSITRKYPVVSTRE